MTATMVGLVVMAAATQTRSKSSFLPPRPSVSSHGWCCYSASLQVIMIARQLIDADAAIGPDDAEGRKSSNWAAAIRAQRSLPARVAVPNLAVARAGWNNGSGHALPR